MEDRIKDPFGESCQHVVICSPHIPSRKERCRLPRVSKGAAQEALHVFSGPSDWTLLVVSGRGSREERIRTALGIACPSGVLPGLGTTWMCISCRAGKF